jgi:hypothetical protein
VIQVERLIRWMVHSAGGFFAGIPEDTQGSASNGYYPRFALCAFCRSAPG